MLTVKVDENYREAADFLGVTVPHDAVVMTMKDGEKIMGMGVMRLFETHAFLDGIYMAEDYRDFSLEYGMGKSLLNVIDLRGISHVASDNMDIEKQLAALRFKKISEVESLQNLPTEVQNCRMYLNLEGYFLANC